MFIYQMAKYILLDGTKYYKQDWSKETMMLCRWGEGGGEINTK